MLGFLRLLTNRRVMGESELSLAEALELYDRWAEDARIQFAPEPRSAEQFFRLAMTPFSHQPATKAIADCYLVGFAEATGASVVTFDKGLAAAAGFRDVLSVLLEPIEKLAKPGAPSQKRSRRRMRIPRRA